MRKRTRQELRSHFNNHVRGLLYTLIGMRFQALKTTWQKVNRDFGSIFSTLLPGTMAKLEPPEGCTVEDGLEVKVLHAPKHKTLSLLDT